MGKHIHCHCDDDNAHIEAGSSITLDAKLDHIIPFKATCPACGANCSFTVPIIKEHFSWQMPDCPLSASMIKPPGEGELTSERAFEGLDRRPISPVGTPGERLKLVSESSGSVSVGSPET